MDSVADGRRRRRGIENALAAAGAVGQVDRRAVHRIPEVVVWLWPDGSNRGGGVR